MMVALFHDSPATRSAAERLLERLREVGENLAVFSDSDSCKAWAGVRFRALRVDGRILEPEAIRQQVAEWQDVTRIVFDVHADLDADRAVRLMEIVDRAVFFVAASSGDTVVRRLQRPGRAGARLARQDQRRLAPGWRSPGGPGRTEPPRRGQQRFQDRDDAGASGPGAGPWRAASSG